MGLSNQESCAGSRRFLRLVGFLVGALGVIAAGIAKAEPAVVMDVASGDILYQEQATVPWFPASLTKLMTMYVTLSAVRDHKIALDTPLVVSARAASQVPSKMGFAPGTQVTLENAMKMLMVKSANDMAITIAEGVSGSVEAFADDMNAAAASLGLRQSHFVNPNGLPDPAHMSSARDLAIIARALYLSFPEYAGIYAIGALKLGDETIPTHNNLLGRYAGADGMKTGFTCAAGFNLVASAQRYGHHYIAVVLGAPTVAQRLVKAAILLDRAFTGIDRPQNINFAATRGLSTLPPNLHDEVCKRRSIAIARFQTQLETLQAPLAGQSSSFVADNALFMNAPNEAQKAKLMSKKLLSAEPAFEPVSVYVGPAPGYTGLIAQARPPHSPVGTEPPPETANAYAAVKPASTDLGAVPLKPDVAALPMKGRRGKAMIAARSRSLARTKVSVAEETRAKPVPNHKAASKKVVGKGAVAKAKGDADAVGKHAAKAKPKVVTPTKGKAAHGKKAD